MLVSFCCLFASFCFLLASFSLLFASFSQPLWPPELWRLIFRIPASVTGAPTASVMLLLLVTRLLILPVTLPLPLPLLVAHCYPTKGLREIIRRQAHEDEDGDVFALDLLAAAFAEV